MNYQTSFKFNLQRGFTLAEVLTVITIVGIIAMQTIPVLITNSMNAAIVASVRKTMSMTSQVCNSFIADNVTMDTVFGVDNVTALNQFCTKLNCVKICGAVAGCFPNVIYTYLDGITPWSTLDTDNTIAKAILADGSSISMKTYTAGCNNNKGSGPLLNTCGLITFDINGFKGPNVYSRDIFQFWITRTGVIPTGSNGDTRGCVTGGTGFNSNGCTAKVLTDGAVNY